MKKVSRNGGFTLVELLAVIVVLGIIALIAYPLVTGTIENSRNKLGEEQFKRLDDAVRSYITKSVSEDETCVSVTDLKKGGYLEDVTIRNPDGGEVINGIYRIHWNNDNNQYTWTYDGSQTSC